MAAVVFSNHTSNDYEIANTPENYEMMQDALKWSGDENNQTPEVWEDGSGLSTIVTQDYFLMSYFAHLAKQLADEME